MAILENLNDNISDDVQTKLHWLLCNTNITKETQVKLIDMMNESFIEGTKYHRNESIDSVVEK